MNSYHLSNPLKEITAQSTLQQMTCQGKNQHRTMCQRAGEFRAFHSDDCDWITAKPEEIPSHLKSEGPYATEE